MKKFFQALFAAILLISGTVSGYAQNTSFGITPVGTTQAMSVTSASSSITLSATFGATVLVQNTGSKTAYIKGGASTVNATTSDFPIQPGWGIVFNYPSGTTVAAITGGSDTTTLLVSKGMGSTAITGGLTGGGGGTVIVGGNVSNAASAVATTSTNAPTVAYNYGFNGTTWDQLQVDANKYLKIVAQPSENHAAEVGGNILPITSALVTSINTVTTGKAIGPLQTLANAVRVSGALGASGTSGLIQSVVVTFTDAVGSGPLDVYYFNASPSGSTCTDNTLFALAAADKDKVIGVIHVADFTASNTAAIAQANTLAVPFGVASATSIYACVVARGSFAITGTANASLITRILRN